MDQADERHLRAIERGLRAADPRWARQVFGEVAWPLRRCWPVLSLAVDAVAVGLIVAGLLAVLPLVFAGFLLLNVAVCMHLERVSRRVPRR